ncbi:protein FAM69C-like [Lingula anatina]|uniref:Protein FAM69C-like n=1 Tax=Lingula anatina TaxID=7574 RepID=A0A1S3I3I9_LINAN|nr:protein FAM69C-like [Lingula anatina]XP_013392831.1 protein FAM69C-like [Lingula anatina]|eukprot:XP_013392830.1 protein FAM69C-like [Lingula anatina]
MRVFRCRRSVSRKLVVSLVILAVVTLAVVKIRSILKKMLCSEEESRLMIKELCKLYKTQNAAGNICPDLCETYTLKYVSCTNYREGKKILIMNWKGKKAVLKSKYAFKHDYDGLLFGEDVNKDLDLPVSEFLKMAQESIVYNIGHKMERNLQMLTDVWSLDFKDYINVPKSSHRHPKKTAMEDLWALIQQQEYLFMKIFQDKSKHIPRIYGTCGHAYLMEHTPPGEFLDNDVPRVPMAKKETWKKRAKIALGLLDLLQSFQNDLPEEFNMCDIKGENFGLAEDETVKAIDVDMAFLDSKLGMELLSVGNCTAHKDCDFFDCKGWCDLSEGQCTRNRINNNLQAVCKDIFLSGLDNIWHGLLSSPPLSIEQALLEEIEECANPGNIQHPDIRYKASGQSLQKIRTLIMKTLG